MKVLQSSFFRAICAIIVGVLLLKYSAETTLWLTISIGVLFFLSGIISCAVYFSAKKSKAETQIFDAQGNQIASVKPSFPVVGVGSLILGVILALMPNVFSNALMYVLSAILILGAINLFVVLGAARKYTNIGFFYWILPSVILLIGIVIIVKHIDPIETVLDIIGWSMLLYGFTECLYAIKIGIARRKVNKAAEAAETSQQTEDENAIEVVDQESTEEVKEDSISEQDSTSNEEPTNI